LPKEGLRGSEIEADDGVLINVLGGKLPNFGKMSSNLMAREGLLLYSFSCSNYEEAKEGALLQYACPALTGLATRTREKMLL
jgi:hypothetical protein